MVETFFSRLFERQCDKRMGVLREQLKAGSPPPRRGNLDVCASEYDHLVTLHLVARINLLSHGCVVSNSVT